MAGRDIGQGLKEVEAPCSMALLFTIIAERLRLR